MIPKDWQNFLRLSNIITELFKLLNEEVVKTASREQVFIVTDDVDMHCVPVCDKTNIAPCNHEEVDSRIPVHVADAFMRGCLEHMEGA